MKGNWHSKSSSFYAESDHACQRTAIRRFRTVESVIYICNFYVSLVLNSKLHPGAAVTTWIISRCHSLDYLIMLFVRVSTFIHGLKFEPHEPA